MQYHLAIKYIQHLHQFYILGDPCKMQYRLVTSKHVVFRKFLNIHPLMCKALISLPTSEETSGKVTILLVTSPAVSN